MQTKHLKTLLICFLLCCITITGCGNSNVKEFQENVDKFCESYNKNVISEDPLYKDVGLKNCVAALGKMTELYEDSKNQKAYNDYMRGKISYSTVEIILQYDQDEGTNRIKDGQLLEYLRGAN